MTGEPATAKPQIVTDKNAEVDLFDIEAKIDRNPYLRDGELVNPNPLPIPRLKMPRIHESPRPSKGQLDSYDLPDDPLADLELTGDLTDDTKAEFNAIQKGFIKRQKRDQARFRTAVDAEFFTIVCFQSQEQREVFLREMGWAANGDRFIDGTWLAFQYGIKLPEVHLVNKKTRKDPKLKAIAGEDDELLVGEKPTEIES
ncbi:MAG: hypothetical protein KC496_03570 [Anaerolineae bacterium]|nr:hypothetical protein [Anaerolineae bacterium]